MCGIISPEWERFLSAVPALSYSSETYHHASVTVDVEFTRPEHYRCRISERFLLLRERLLNSARRNRVWLFQYLPPDVLSHCASSGSRKVRCGRPQHTHLGRSKEK